MRLLALLLAALTMLLAVLPARADELRPGYLELTQQDAAHWRMVWKAPVLGGLATHARPQFPAFCTIRQCEASCWVSSR